MEDKVYLDAVQFAKDLREFCEKEFPKIVCTTKYFEQVRIRMELEKGQIKKATECCATRACDNCPYTDNKEMCFQISEAHTIIKDLLNRIEILESLNSVNDKVGEDYATLHAAYTELTRTCMTLTQKVKELNEQYDALLARNSELTEENERLRTKVGSLKCYADQFDATIYAFQYLFDIRANTVREMRKRIKSRCIEGGIYPAFVENVIDQIAQEMLEGK